MKRRSKVHTPSSPATPPRARAPRVRGAAIPVVVFAEHVEGHRLRLGFQDGSEGDLDIATIVGTFSGVFAPLRRPSYFRRVRVDPDLGTISWPNGADIAPETLRDALTHVTRARRRRVSPPSPDSPALGTNGSMPEICRFFGVVIQMYFSETHAPHFHVRYAGTRASLDIGTLAILSGSLPPRVLGFVTEWASLHRSELSENWERARRGRKLRSIAPLE